MNKPRHLSLLWKILFSTSVAITALFAFTGWIVQREAIRATSETLDVEVRASFRAYESLWRARAKLFSSVSSILSSMSDVRAAFGTGDQETIRDTASDLWRRVSSEAAVFVVADPRGRPIASLGGVPFGRADDLPVVRQAAPAFPKQSSGFLIQNGSLYQVTVTPVYVESTGGPALINVLVAGFAVDDLLARELKDSAGGSEFVFFDGRQQVIASTVPRMEAGQLTGLANPTNALRRAVAGGTEFASLTTPLRNVEGKPIGSLAILRSFRAASLGIRQLQREIIAIWMFAVLAGLLLTYVLARRILEPVDRLDKAAAEIARGNYEHRVAVTSNDELGRLSATFNGMCQSIRDAREDLIRQERISTVGRLSSSIVHDLRNPLAAIYGGAEMLVDNDLPAPQIKRLAQNLYQASRRIQEMLQDLVNISRGKVEAFEPCRLHEVVAAACESLNAAAVAQDVAIYNDVPAEIELPLDRARMERVFFNLIDNALEAMPEGGEVRVSAASEGGSVLVRIDDTGPGIANSIRPHLFRPFVTAGKRNGLGLGLTLSRQTVLDHGGDMWADPAPERGARFWMRLVNR